MFESDESLAGWFTVSQAARLLGIRRRTLVAFLVRHPVPTRLIGQTRVLRLESLAEAGLKVPLNVSQTLARLLK